MCHAVYPTVLAGPTPRVRRPNQRHHHHAPLPQPPRSTHRRKWAHTCANSCICELSRAQLQRQSLQSCACDPRAWAQVKKDGGPRLAVLGEKQVFGDMALLDDEPRSASVVAIGEVHLLSLQRSNLERILRRYASISFNMMRILSHRLREAQAS